MTDADQGSWIDDQQPLDDEASARQIQAVLGVLGASPRKVLDLGCGSGRVLLPLAEHGHHPVGVDREGRWLQACRQRLDTAGLSAELHECDWRELDPASLGPFDAVCCLGYSFALLADVDEAVDLLRRVRASLAPGGVVLLDDIPGDLWPELIGGNWLAGISEDHRSQLVWDPDDAVFTVRYDAAVDPDSWQRGPTETPVRLWTMGSLRLVARASGLSAPARQDTPGLLVMHIAES